MTTIAAGALIPVTQINQWCPPGIVDDFAGAVAPDGWLLCDGASYLRSDYPALFAVIGTTYGAADGTHFNVPDCRGRVPVGYAASGGHTDVSTLGGNDGQAVANRRTKHRTSLTDPGHVHQEFSSTGAGGALGVQGAAGTSASTQGTVPNTASAVTGITVGTGNANDALDTPSYIVLNRIIRAKDV